MKQLSQSIINSAKSFSGRWTKVTAMGCMLALVCLVATGAKPQSSKQARPFNATAIYTAGATFGTFQVSGNATHLGRFVGEGTFWVTLDGILQVEATWTAANGDTLELAFPEWLFDFPSDISYGGFNILGGTGRFANASGSGLATISPISSTPGIPNILTAEGTISY